MMSSLIFAALACPWMALAQTPVPSAPQSPVLNSRTTLVLVPALVKTKSGEPVFTLTAQDFVVTDDGIAQKAAIDEDTGSDPLALVIVVEVGGAGARQLASYRRLGPSVEAVIGAVQHKIAVVQFDGAPQIALDFTADLSAVGESLQGLEPGDRNAAILDSLRFSVDLLRKQPPSYRRAILLISETVDHGSQSSLEQALRDVSDTNTAIYSLNFSSAKSDASHELAMIYHDPTPGPAGGCMSRGPDVDLSKSRTEQTYNCLGLLAPPLRLAKIAAILASDGLKRNAAESVAQLTGGESFSFNDARSLERDVQAISHHLPNRYLLSFYPAAPHPGFHAIGIRLKNYPDLVVTGRDGYWAEQETTAEAGSR
ncbi:MAG: VWA domain-containing protein [Terracidiphilus sp.]|jgi:VWFA-related protein